MPFTLRYAKARAELTPVKGSPDPLHARGSARVAFWRGAALGFVGGVIVFDALLLRGATMQGMIYAVRSALWMTRQALF